MTFKYDWLYFKAFCPINQVIKIKGCENLHQLYLYWHVDGEEHPDGVCLPQDQGVLQGEAWAGVPGGGHEVGGQGWDDRWAHDNCSLYEWTQRMSKILHGTQLYLFWCPKVSILLSKYYSETVPLEQSLWEL